MAALTPIEQALDSVLAAVRPLDAETVAVADATGRVLAADVHAAGDSPPFACSAMDGYAIVAGDAGRRLTVAGESRAGAPSPVRVTEVTAVRVSTGAVIPAGATAVVPQEETEREGDTVTTTATIRAGRHVRGAGEDMRAGEIVLAAGTPLGPIEIGAAIAAGAGAVEVSRRPRLAVLATGDELRAAGADLAPGAIHDTNGPMLTGLATRCGAVTRAPERVADDRTTTVEAIGAALRSADVVVISGGVSVGPHDHVKPALEQLGVREEFWSVALQPGKPTWFGIGPAAPGGTADMASGAAQQLGERPVLVFGLPGNPVSSVVTFSLFVAPALAALQCGPAPRAPHPTARLATAVARNSRRDQAIRVSLRQAGSQHGDDHHGELVAEPTGAQGSHILSSLLAADALAMIPTGDGELPAGAIVQLRALVR